MASGNPSDFLDEEEGETDNLLGVGDVPYQGKEYSSRTTVCPNMVAD